MTRYGQIIEAVSQALQGVTMANGYATDAGYHVHLRREFETCPPDKPAVVFWPGEVVDTLDGDTPPSQGEENHYLPIKIEGFIDTDERGGSADDLRRDILAALKEDRLFGGLTEGYLGQTTSSATVEEAGEAGLLGLVTVDATIFYVTAYGEI